LIANIWSRHYYALLTGTTATNHIEEHWITGRHLSTHLMCTALVGCQAATTLLIIWTNKHWPLLFRSDQFLRF